ncbi:L-serine ammonia-lyase [Clostridium collagenovorans DSM 3089]|uniref:L-serine dehydratase n=1 Tax=Clostridium collagenovorans DSM 3089 TaxID=1121306 RepID=A0A1M5XY00_9CLOT|nr:L-serine ammonia-lyase [Clostridium collagenovorans DSM 3089]
MIFANKGKELVEICNRENISIAEYCIRYEMENSDLSREEVIEAMKKNLDVMKDSANFAINNDVKSVSGLIGGDAKKIKKYADNNKSLSGEVMIKAMARASSSSEVNAAMGRIVAAPTAGSCGILPSVIITAGEQLNSSDEEMVKGLFTAAGVGNIIAQNATLAGAAGGCQAECGSAAAMGAAAAVEMMGGTPDMALHAASIVFKNILGLVCDPIAGLVEVPCAKRNIAGAVSALTTADLAMAGVKSVIPFDEVVDAMYRVGKQLPSELRETAKGGLAITPTGLKLEEQIMGRKCGK